jgi:hypothetical protein
LTIDVTLEIAMVQRELNTMTSYIQTTGSSTATRAEDFWAPPLPKGKNVIQKARSYETSPWSLGGTGTLTLLGGQSSYFGDDGAYKLTADASAKRIEQTVTVTTNPQYVYCYFKPDTTTDPQLRIDNNSIAYAVTFDTSTGIATAAGLGPVSNINFYELEDGYWFAGFGYTPTGTSSIVRLYPKIGSIYLDIVQHNEGTEPVAPENLQIAFDDDSSQTYYGMANGEYIGGSTLNRPLIKRVEVV